MAERHDARGGRAAATSSTSPRSGASARRSRTTSPTCASTSRPFFGDLPLDRIGRADVEAFIAEKRADGRAPKSVAQLPRPAARRLRLRASGRAGRRGNPLQAASSRPRADEATPTSASSTTPSSRRCCAPCPTTRSAPLDRVLYLTAAMTGLRQGELLGAALARRRLGRGARPRAPELRPRRVRHARSRSARSRSVPLADRLAGELERHFQALGAIRATTTSSSAIPRPARRSTRSGSLKRFKAAPRRARGVRRRPLPRPAPHLRHPHGRGRRAAADAAGVDGPPRLQDHR